MAHIERPEGELPLGTWRRDNPPPKGARAKHWSLGVVEVVSFEDMPGAMTDTRVKPFQTGKITWVAARDLAPVPDSWFREYVLTLNTPGDKEGKVGFTLDWVDPEGEDRPQLAPDGLPVGQRRAQCFRADPFERVRTLLARGHKVVIGPVYPDREVNANQRAGMRRMRDLLAKVDGVGTQG